MTQEQGERGPTGEKVEAVADKEALIDFLVNYGGQCRDCADENGFCPRTGIGCGQRKKAAIFFVSALEYGSKNGFAGGYTLASAETVAALVAERDEARSYASMGCDANGGGPHSIIKQGTYQFCKDCGLTVKNPTLAERCRASEARATAAERERDEWKDMFEQCKYKHGEMTKRANAMNARVAELEKALKPVFEQADHVSLGLATPLDVKDATRELIRLIATVPGSATYDALTGGNNG